MTAELSFQDKRGYYGLTVEPSYEEMLKTVRNKIRIPQPDRRARWYAVGPYRAFLLEQAKRFNDAQRKDLEFDETGAQLPAAAERRASFGAMLDTDDVWDRIDQFGSNLDAEDARRVAEDALQAERKQQANALRSRQLSAYEPTSGHWTVEAHHKDLEYRGIPHSVPTPPLAKPAGQWQAPPNEYISTGQPQAKEFPTFEQLNGLHDSRYKLGRPAPVPPSNYEQLRANYL